MTIKELQELRKCIQEFITFEDKPSEKLKAKSLRIIEKEIKEKAENDLQLRKRNVKIKRAIRETEEYRENLFTPTDEFMMDKEIEILKFILGEEYYD